MAGKLKDLVSEDVKCLIKHLTGFEEHEDNFKACERFIFSNIIHHRYLSVDSHALRRSIDGVVCKLRFHGLFKKADKLDKLVKAFLESKDYKDHPTVDIQWALLSFLLHSANNPSGNDDSEAVSEEQTLGVSLESSLTAEEIVDWEAYLREGDSEFQAHWSDGSLSDLSVSDSDKEEGVTSISRSCEMILESSTGNLSLPAKQLTQKVAAHDIKQQRKETFQQAAEAEKWCRENLQHAWWTEAHPRHEQYPDSSLNLTSLWHESQQEAFKKHNKSKPNVVDTISEHKVVLEVLWMLACPNAISSPLFLAVANSGSITFSARPHITVPGLTQDVYYDLMTEMCLYFGMIKLLQDFSHDLLSRDLTHPPSSTYNAYSSALRKARQPLLDQIIVLEKRAHKQETSLSLMETVQILRPRLKELEIIYDLHQRAVLSWDSNPNWLCAVHILAVLLSELSYAKKNASLLLPIIVKTMEGYVDIADLWFATGALNDSRDEFIIVKSEVPSRGNEGMGDTLSMRPWEKSLRGRNVDIPEMLKTFASKMLSAGRDVEILRRMDRLREIWRITPTRGNFIADVMTTFNKAIKKYSVESGELKECVHEGEAMTTSTITEPQTPRTILSHFRTLNDPFLDVLMMESLRGSDYSQKAVSPNELYLEDIPHTFPSSAWLRESVISQLEDRWKCAHIGSIVANILINELKLDRHVRFAQSLFLMQAGNILEPFCKILFAQADREMKLSNGMPSSWESIYSLSVILEDSVDTENQDLSSRCSLSQRPIVFNEKRSPAVTDTLDTLELCYSVDWPLTLVLSRGSIERYNQLFRFLIKIKWGVWALLQMRFSDVRAHCDHPLLKRVMHLRIWLLHALSNSFTFLAGQILNNLWEAFLKEMRAAKDLETFVRAHNDFLEAAHEQCLRPSNPDVIKNSLLQMVVIAEKLRALWKGGPDNISKSRLLNMEKCYIDCHAFLVEYLRCPDDNNKHLASLYEVFWHSNPLDSIVD